MDNQDTFDAAENIDKLLEGSDGALLAAMARYRSNLLELIGRDGIVEILRTTIDQAPNVEYFSRRSRREIDPARPEVNLRVDHAAAVKAGGDTLARYASAVSRAQISEADLTAVKAAVIYDQVCRPMASRMNELLAPHWQKAKTYMQENQLVRDKKDLIMLLCTLFSVRVGTDASVPADERMCSLIVFI